jgi:hypothetical protein
MNNLFIENLKKLLEDNLIPYMEIVKGYDDHLDATIKVYFPKIMLNICKFFDKKFILEDKKNIVMKKDEQGYSFVELSLFSENERKTIRLDSILQNTWGIADNY